MEVHHGLVGGRRVLVESGIVGREWRESATRERDDEVFSEILEEDVRF